MNQQRICRLTFQQLQNLLRSGLQQIPRPSGQFRLPEEIRTRLETQTPLPPLRTEAQKPIAGKPAAEAGHAGLRSRTANDTLSTSESERVPQQNEQTGLPHRSDEPNQPLFQNADSMTDRYSTPRLSTDDRISGLAVIRQEVSRCQLCPDLCSTRKNTVFGDGPPQVRLCFVGEGPGADEDREGIPFVGRAGQLLNKIIEACRMKRSEVYILNTVKCRPPGNRNPHDSELENCWPFAERQLEILQPEFICCLGSVAARTMLKTNESIGRLRGRFFGYRGSQVMVTYHPAYLLRNPPAKVQVWDDMQLLMKAMGQPV